MDFSIEFVGVAELEVSTTVSGMKMPEVGLVVAKSGTILDCEASILGCGTDWENGVGFLLVYTNKR
jgi:hypothetical protein